MSAEFSRPCVHHERLSLRVSPRGLCARCREPFCALCLTKVDGVNHCASCYAEAAQEARSAAAQRAPEVHPRRVAFALACLWLAVWGALEFGFGATGIGQRATARSAALSTKFAGSAEVR